MLPDSGIDPARARDNPNTFADTGIPLLLAEVCKFGGSKQRLTAYAVGGAQMMDSERFFEIGERNQSAARKILKKEGVLLTTEVVGGDLSRSLRLEVGSGRLWVQEGSQYYEIGSARPLKGAAPWRTGW